MGPIWGAADVIAAKDVVLGLVIERPGYGYDLARRLVERFGSSAFAPTGVYSALDQLSTEALVRSVGAKSSANERAAPRTVYQATAKGIDHFEAWMLEGSGLAPVRDELYVKIALSRPRNLPRLIELAESQERECLARISELRQLSASYLRGTEREWSEVAILLVRDAEMRQLQARVEWLQKAAVVMRRLSSQARLADGSIEDRVA